MASVTEEIRLFLQGAFGQGLENDLDYPTQVTAQDLRRKYERSGIARALVDARPDATWSGDNPFTLDGNESDELNEIASRYDLEHVMFRADISSEMTGFAGIYLPGPIPSDPPTAAELEEYGLSVFGYDQLQPTILGGMVTSYNLADQEEERGGDPISIAPERVIPVSDTRYSASGIFGAPRLRAAWNLLLDLERVVGGGSLAFYRNAFGIKQLDYPSADAMPTELQQKRVQQTLRDLDNDPNKVVTTFGATFSLHAPRPITFNADATRLLGLLAAAFRVPLTVVTGEALVAHSASTALSDWNTRIGERRRVYAEPRIASPLMAWIRSILSGGGGMVTREEKAAIGMEWTAASVGDDAERTDAIIQAVREGLLDSQRALELLPESWFGPVEQRLLGEVVAPMDESMDPNTPPPEGEPFDAPIDDSDGFGLPVR